MPLCFRLSILMGLMLQCAHVSIALGSQGPNFVLIISDDQAWTDYGFMGHLHVDTPNLDELAAESLTYTRGYVASPLCRPSLASILTGLPSHVHGNTGNDPATGDTTIRNMKSRAYPRHDSLHEVLYDRLRKLPNVVRVLQESGYATLQTGKWWEADPREFGFSRAMTHGDHARGARHGDDGLTISRQGIEPIREFLDGVVGVDGAEAKPFFIWHAPFLPHTPHNPPDELLAKYRKVAPTEPVASYWAMCEWFDQTCGELLTEIDHRGLRETTVVLYITDNGWIQHPMKANRFAPRSKTTPYEGGVRTPIMLRWPGHIAARLDTETLVSAIDIAPTILGISGMTVPKSMPGIDLRDTLALKQRRAVFGSDHPHNIPDVHAPTEGVESRYVIEGPWKLIAHGRPARKVELYHLEADPYEKVNLSEARPTVVSGLMVKIQRWWSR